MLKALLSSGGKIIHMPRRLSHRFRSLPRQPGYVLAGWPRSLRQVEAVAFSRPCRRRDLMAIARWAGLTVASARKAGISLTAVRELAAIASVNGYSNGYHQSGHYAHVVIAAGLLAAATGLGKRDTAILVLAALVHDIDHHGRRSTHRLYGQEIWSARLAARILVRHGGDARLAARLKRLLKATALTNDAERNTILATDHLAGLLTDADVFASVFFDRDRARHFTRLLKLEQRLPGTPDDLLTRFLALITAEGLQSDAARAMLDMRNEARNRA